MSADNSPKLSPNEQQEIIKVDLEHVWHPLTQHKVLEENPPLVMVGGHGSTVVTAEGREYLDAFAGLWCVNVGYGRQTIADAAYEQMKQLAYFPHTQANIPATRLADKLADLTNHLLTHTYFVNSGSEANEAAFKLARQYQRQVRPTERRYKIIGRRLSYHGTTIATLAAGGLPDRKAKYEPLAEGFLHVDAPYCYRCPLGLEYPSCGVACAKQVEATIRAEGPETVAAVVMEPIQTGVGILVPPKEYWPIVDKACKDHGVLLIADEVINGFGRTGKWFGHQHFDMKPDILALAKGISSAYLPLAATMTTDEVFRGFLGDPAEGRQAFQVNTYGGHPVACAAGLENVRIMEAENLPGRAAEIGEYLLAGLRSLLELPYVGDVRGIGLLAGVELVVDKKSKQPMPNAQMNQVMKGCMQRGVIVGRSGAAPAGLGNTINLSPPLVITREECDRLVQVLREVISELKV